MMTITSHTSQEYFLHVSPVFLCLNMLFIGVSYWLIEGLNKYFGYSHTNVWVMLNKIVFLNCIYEAVQNKNVICLALLLICFSVFLRLIIEKEGLRSLFRGLGPNLIGVAPSR